MSWTRKTCAGAATVALLLALTAPAAAQDEAASEDMQAVPIEGTVVGAHWIDPTAPACDEGTSWRFSSAGAGELTELGEVDYYLTHCTMFDEASGGAGSAYVDALTTFTTAEGDTLAVVHQFPSTEVFVDDAGAFTGFTLDGTWEAVGGSGRFADVAGSGSMAGAADIPGEIVLDLTGEIIYGAAGRPE